MMIQRMEIRTWWEEPRVAENNSEGIDGALIRQMAAGTSGFQIC